MKQVVFWGDALKTIRKFPANVSDRVADQLRQIRRGNTPLHWKPMPNIGAGVIEIRIRNKAGAFRVFYVAKFEETVYVLHAFQKKTQKTSPADIEKGRRRYNEVLKHRQT